MRLCDLIFVAVLLCLQTTVVSGHDNEEIKQKGYVRTQSFFGAMESKPLPNAYVKLDDDQLVVSKSDGFFELNMQDYVDGSPFRIVDVSHMMGRYKLLTDEYLRTLYRYNPLTPILIIMKDEVELDEYVNSVVEKSTEEIRRECDAEINKIKADAVLSVEEKEKEINRLNHRVIKLKKKNFDQTKKILSESDYETSDSLTRAICEAIFEGDIKKVDSLNRCRGDISALKDSIAMANEIVENNKARVEESQKTYEYNLRARDFLVEQLIERVNVNLFVASNTMKLDSIMFYYNTLIEYEPMNIRNYIDAGEFAENILCDLAIAEQYYEKANEKAKEYGADIEDLTESYLHLGKLLMFEGHYSRALRYLNQAKELCADNESNEQTIRTYLLLGEWETLHGNSVQALEYFNKVSCNRVEKQFYKRYAEARVNIAAIKMTYGQFKEAKSILGELNFDNMERYSLEDFDLTHSFRMAYSEYLMACNKYEDALSYIEESERLLNAYHTGDNYYTASILLKKSMPLYQLGNVREAISCIDKAVRITRDVFGNTHPSYITSLIMSSECLTSIGEFRLAEDMAIEALDGLKDKFGAYDFNTLAVRGALIHMYELLQENNKALEQIKICKEIISKDELSRVQDLLDLEYRESILSEEAGGPKKSLQIALKYMQCIEKEHGENSRLMIEAYNRLGNSSLALGDSEKAEDYFKKALSITENIYGKNSVFSKMQEMNNLTSLPTVGKENIDKALKSIAKVETSLIEMLGEESFMLAYVYKPLSSYYATIGNASKAKECAGKYYEIIRRMFNDDHRLMVEPLMCLYSANMLEGNVKGAEEIILKAIDITLREYGENSGYMFVCSGFYIDVLINQGRVKDARREIERYFESVKSTFGDDNMMMASALMRTLFYEYDPKAIKNVYDNVLDIYAKLLDENDYNYIDLYLKMAEYESVNSNIASALKYYDKAVSVIRYNYGENSIKEASSLSVLLNIYSNNGDLQAMRTVFGKIKQQEKVLGSIPGVDMSLLEAEYYLWNGEYTKAINAVNSYLKTLHDKFGEDCLWECDALTLLATANMTLSEFDTAKLYFEKSIEISQRILGDDKVFNVVAYEGLATILVQQASLENCAKANSIYKSLKAQFIKQFGLKHPKTIEIDSCIGMSYMTLAQITGDINDYKEACKYLKQSLDANKEIYRDDASLPLATSNLAMANCYVLGGEAENALTHYKAALTLYEEIYGEEHKVTLTALVGVGQTYGTLGDLDKAEEYYQRAISVIDSNLEEMEDKYYEVFFSMAQVYSLNGCFDKSAELLERCLKILDDEVATINDMSVATLKLHLAGVYFALEKYNLLFDLLEQVLDTVKESVNLSAPQKFNIAYSGVQILFSCPDVKNVELMDRYLILAENHISHIENMSNNTEYYIYMCRSALCKMESDIEGYTSNLHKAYSLAKKCKVALPEHLEYMKTELELLRN